MAKKVHAGQRGHEIYLSRYIANIILDSLKEGTYLMLVVGQVVSSFGFYACVFSFPNDAFSTEYLFRDKNPTGEGHDAGMA